MIKQYKNIESDVLTSLTLTPRSIEVLMMANIINFTFTLAAKFKALISNKRY